MPVNVTVGASAGAAAAATAAATDTVGTSNDVHFFPADSDGAQTQGASIHLSQSVSLGNQLNYNTDGSQTQARGLN